MADLSKISVILPSLDPDEKLNAVIDGLLEYGFSDIILVNDGSKPENLHYFTDAFWRLKQVVDSGELGKVCHAQVDSFWWRGHCYYDLWWRGTWEKEGGGCTLNHAVHHIDAIQWMLGFPTEVVAMMTNVAHDNAEVEDLSAAIFRYSSGALTQLTASVVHHGEDQKIVIQGDKARISAPWDVWASVSADNGFPQDQHNDELEARLDGLFRNTPKLKYTLHTGQINDLLNAVEQHGEPLITAYKVNARSS